MGAKERGIDNGRGRREGERESKRKKEGKAAQRLQQQQQQQQQQQLKVNGSPCSCLRWATTVSRLFLEAIRRGGLQPIIFHA